MSDTILITGASSGIGRATAEHFRDRGWNVVATMRNPDDGAALAAHDDVLVTRLDVTDTATIRAAVDEAVDRFGRIDALLNNAGYGAYGVLESTSSETIRRQFETNVIGLLEVTRAVLPQFRTQGGGTLVNVSSIGGRMTFPLGSLYHGTKFAVEGISEALAWELESVGVRVKIVEPGLIATDFGGRSFDFTNDESLVEYQPLVATVLGAFQQMSESASPATLVADVVYEAVTDVTDRLRYPAGPDAEMFMAARTAQDDATFLAAQREQMGV